ncbi:MAG TPA: endolytic transglycosylase MltG [Bacteroidales bacterium]|nr:endolytic transglycosylase MltG [Bacteroidales bacterium]
MTKKNTKTKGLIIIGIFLGVLLVSGSWIIYSFFFKPSVHFTNGSDSYLFAIPTGSNISNVIEKLQKETQWNSTTGFMILSKVLDLENHIYPGLYKLSANMNNKDLALLFRSGKRETVDVVIRFGRYAQDIARTIAPKLEADYDELTALLQNSSFLDSLGFTKETAICLFLPDTYEFKWNTNAIEFIQRMHKEYNTFWNNERLQKAQSIGFTPQQIMTLASIINQETNKNDEKPKIAGVYINRLKQNMPLQADPTVKYAVGDFSLKRIYHGHLQVNSPYNTYRNIGLPPGPICTPQKSDIEAVLNYENHSYLFFCARPDYSGYHNFAKTYNEHLQFAGAYSKWLNQEQIR